MSTLATLVAFGGYRPAAVAARLTHVANGQKLPTNDEPYPAPNGREIAIESNRTGEQQIYVISTDGRLLRRVTHHGGMDDSPSWSHDGRHIAYVSLRNGVWGVYVIDADGRNERRLAAGLTYFHPMWSPDDRWIMYNANSKKDPSIYELWVMRADGTEKHALTHNHSSETTYGSWSPDATRILYRRKFLPYRSQVYEARADGTQARNLSNTNTYDGWASWSPDGRTIVFSSNRLEADENSRNSEIFLMDADGSHVRLLSHTGGRNVEPRFSADGKKVYFSHCLHQMCEAYESLVPR